MQLFFCRVIILHFEGGFQIALLLKLWWADWMLCERWKRTWLFPLSKTVYFVSTGKHQRLTVLFRMTWNAKHSFPSYSQLYQCNSKMCSGKLNLKTVHSECTCHFRVQQSMIGSLFWSALVICLQFSLLCNKINACKNNCWSAFHSTEMLKQK